MFSKVKDFKILKIFLVQVMENTSSLGEPNPPLTYIRIYDDVYLIHSQNDESQRI